MNLTDFKKYRILTGLVFACSVFIFCFGHNAHATTTVDIDQSSWDISTSQFGVIGQNFIASSSKLTGIQVISFDAVNADVYLCQGKIVNTTEVFTKRFCGTDKLIASVACSWTGGSWTWRTCTFNQSQILVPGTQYFFTMVAKDNYTQKRIAVVNATTTDFYPQGSRFVTGYPAGIHQNFLMEKHDMAFRTFYDDSVGFCIVDFTKPVAGEVLGTFDKWSLFYSCNNMPDLWLHVKYGVNSGVYQYDDYVSAPNYQNVPVDILLGNTLNKQDYFARAYLYSGTSTIVGQTAEIHFSFGTSTMPTFNFCTNFAQGSPVACENIDTSGFYGGMKCALMQVGYWLVYPTQTTVGGLCNSYTKLTIKFPFNVYYDIANTTNNLFATTTNMTGSFAVPMIRQVGTSSQYYMLNVLSSSSIPNAIGTTNANNIRTGVGWGFWVLYGAYVVFRLIKF